MKCNSAPVDHIAAFQAKLAARLQVRCSSAQAFLDLWTSLAKGWVVSISSMTNFDEPRFTCCLQHRTVFTADRSPHDPGMTFCAFGDTPIAALKAAVHAIDQHLTEAPDAG